MVRKTRRCKRNATFYDIAKKINPGYKGYLTPSMNQNLLERVQEHIKQHKKYNPGDILFIGSTHATRQYYGLVLVMDTEKYTTVWFDTIWDAVFTKKILTSLKQKGVKYGPMLETMDPYTLQLFQGDDVIEKLKSHGIY